MFAGICDLINVNYIITHVFTCEKQYITVK